MPIYKDYAVSKLRGTLIHRVFNEFRRLKHRVTHRVSDGDKILLQRYAHLHRKPLNFTNPQTFTEKLFCRMISLHHAEHPMVTELSDKYAVRAYVASKVGEQYLVKLLWHGTDVKAIPFDSLPSEYVIKTNHACGQVLVVKGKADRTEIVHTLRHWLKTNFYWAWREHQYFYIKPRILIEEYLRNEDGSGPLNYKFWCFAGVPHVIHISNYTHDTHAFYDTEWNQLDLHYREAVSRPSLAKPINFEQMMRIASQLSEGFDFVRVDLYNTEGKVYFGELTFTPMAGELEFRPESWDLKLGMKWQMSSVH